MRAVAMVLVSVMAAAVCVACGPDRKCEVRSAPLADTDGVCPRFGVSTPGGPTVDAEYREVVDVVGRAPAAELWFVDFPSPPPIRELERVRARGADPVITWEPWRALGDGTYDRTTFTMAQIAAGVHDDHLYRWADELAAWGGPVYLRFAHEPNGDWYPWSPAGGTSPETYVAAWRHVHDLLDSKDAHNVRWIWTVNVPYPGSRPIDQHYPGDEYVDLVGVDGYNWGTTQQWSRWQSPEDLFGSTLDEVSELAPGKPVVITEVASAEEGGSKSRWIRDLVTYLDSREHVSGFIWFDHLKEADWRIGSSPESATALEEAVRRDTHS